MVLYSPTSSSLGGRGVPGAGCGTPTAVLGWLWGTVDRRVYCWLRRLCSKLDISDSIFSGSSSVSEVSTSALFSSFALFPAIVASAPSAPSSNLTSIGISLSGSQSSINFRNSSSRSISSVWASTIVTFLSYRPHI